MFIIPTIVDELMEGLCFEVSQAKVSETLYLKTSQVWWINPIIPNSWDHFHLRPVQADRKKREGGRESVRGRERERHREIERWGGERERGERERE
jgi:hypothetical protein